MLSVSFLSTTDLLLPYHKATDDIFCRLRTSCVLSGRQNRRCCLHVQIIWLSQQTSLVSGVEFKCFRHETRKGLGYCDKVQYFRNPHSGMSVFISYLFTLRLWKEPSGAISTDSDTLVRKSETRRDAHDEKCVRARTCPWVRALVMSLCTELHVGTYPGDESVYRTPHTVNIRSPFHVLFVVY
jgi:hypothetical protein